MIVTPYDFGKLKNCDHIRIQEYYILTIVGNSHLYIFVTLQINFKNRYTLMI